MQIHHWQRPHWRRWFIRRARFWSWCGYKIIRWERRMEQLRQLILFNADTAAASRIATSQGRQRVSAQTSKPLRRRGFINLSSWCFVWVSIHDAVGKEILPFPGVCIICLSDVFCRTRRCYSFFEARKGFGFPIVEFGYAPPAQRKDFLCQKCNISKPSWCNEHPYMQQKLITWWLNWEGSTQCSTE